MSAVYALPEWKTFLTEIRSRPARIMLLGAVDTGKSYFAKFLVENLASPQSPVGYIDADLGQSTIGPPGTVGYVCFQHQPDDWDIPNPTHMQFVGTFSPGGHLLQTVMTVGKILDRIISASPRYLILDTSGFITGSAALELKWNKLNLFRPDYVVAFQRSGELESVLHLVSARCDLKICRLPIYGGVKIRSREQRRQYREKRLKSYFAKSTVVELPIQKFTFYPIWFNRGISLTPEELAKFSHLLRSNCLYGIKTWEGISLLVDGPYSKGLLSDLQYEQLHSNLTITNLRELQDLLIGFQNGHDSTLALGILIDFKFPEKKLLVKTPLTDFSKVKMIQFGSVYFNVWRE